MHQLNNYKLNITMTVDNVVLADAPDAIADTPLPALNALSVTADDDGENDGVDDEDHSDDEADEENETCPSLEYNVNQGDTLIFLPCSAKCKICCALPFRRSTKDDESEGILWDDASPWDWDGGLYDLVCQLDGREQYPKLPPDIAKVTVEGLVSRCAISTIPSSLSA